MAVSCFLGVTTHLVLDFPMHWYNSILWHWANPYHTIGSLFLLFTPIFDIWAAYLNASTIMHVGPCPRYRSAVEDMV